MMRRVLLFLLLLACPSVASACSLGGGVPSVLYAEINSCITYQTALNSITPLSLGGVLTDITNGMVYPGAIWGQYPTDTNPLATNYLPELIQQGLGPNYTYTPARISLSSLTSYFNVLANLSVANVVAYGADPTGVRDSTSAFNTAIASGLCVFVPPGTYLVTNAVTMPATNGCMFGNGRTLSTIIAYSTSFNLSAQGVLVLPGNAGATGSYIHDIGFDFNQPQVSARASIVAFPPAIYAQGSARDIIQNVRVSDSNVCLDARGNDGGWFVDNFECGALTAGMYWDGALDTVHWNDFHFWNFGAQLAGSQQLFNVYNDGTNICFRNGRIDDLTAKGTDCFIGNVSITTNAASGGLEQEFDDLFLDSGSQLSVAGGLVKISGGYNSGGASTSKSVIQITGGNTWINHWRIGTGSAPVVPITVTGGKLIIDHSDLACSNANFACATVAAGSLFIDNSIMNPGISYSTAFIAQSGTGFLRFQGNVFFSGSGPGVSYATDETANIFQANLMNGWTVSVPSGHTLGQYFPSELGYTASPQGTDPGLLITPVSGSAAKIVLQAPSGQAADLYTQTAGFSSWFSGVGSNNQYGIGYNGTASVVMTTSGEVGMPILPTSAGSGGLYLCIDSNGNIYKKSSCP